MRTPIAIALLVTLAAPLALVAQSGWRVDPKPLLDLSGNGPGGRVLFARVNSLTRLTNGTIVVGDGMDKALHFFDSKGAAIRSVGRDGNGPGEFKQVTWVGRCSGDSLHVWDFTQQRMAVFAPSGVFARQYPLKADSTSAGSAPLMTLACSTRGILAIQGAPGMPKVRLQPKDPRNPTPAELTIPTEAMVAITGPNGAVTRQIGTRFSGAIFVMGGGGFPLPLAPTTYVAVAADRVVVGTSDSTATITSYAPTGTPTVLHMNIPARRTTPENRSHAARAMAAMAPEQLRQRAEDGLKASPMPSTLPPFSGLFGDSDGVIWVLLSAPGDPTTVLRAIGARGETLGDVSLRAGLQIHEVGRDYILASYEDEDGMPHVVMYRLVRGR